MSLADPPAAPAALIQPPPPAEGLRPWLRQAEDSLRQDLRARIARDPAAGAEAAAGRAALIDQTILSLTSRDAADADAAPIAVVATGGYGRGSLAPCSDIDLLILVQPGSNRSRERAEALLYALWDLGLKLGHAVRSPADCVAAARGDQTILTTLLERRFITGSSSLYAEMDRAYEAKLRLAPGAASRFFAAKQAEAALRHQETGNRRFRVEPDVKAGEGGLRDIQLLGWLMRFVLGKSDPVAAGLMTPEEARDLQQAEQFVLRVRAALHLLQGRDDNRLGFEVQRSIAAMLDYADQDGQLGVERFMRAWFYNARRLGQLVGPAIALIGLQLDRPQRFGGFLRRAPKPPVLPQGWLLTQQRLDAEPGLIERDPDALIRLFRLKAETALDLHPALWRRVQACAPEQGPKALGRAEASAEFLKLLTLPRDPEPALRLMAETGVLGSFIPDFQRVTALMQFDMYHCYTVDEHTLVALGRLNRILAGEAGAGFARAQGFAAEIEDWRSLAMAVLLHDIAKGRDGDHSVLGALVARDLGPLLGFLPEETEEIAWLVRWHLLLSDTATRRDLQDPQTIHDVLSLTGTPERLKRLYVLTVADISAVGPGRFTAWKDQLMQQLVEMVLRAMTGAAPSSIPHEITLERRNATRQLLPDWSDKAFRDYAALGNNGFWLGFSPQDHAHLARIVRLAEEEGRLLTVETRNRMGELATDVIVHVADHPRLFAGICAALSAAGVSIVRAKIFTLGNGMALDVFVVEEASAEAGAVTDPSRRARLATLVRQVLQGDVTLDQMQARFRPHLSQRRRAFTVEPQVRIDNSLSNGWTVIEVTANDRPGLLSDLGRAMADLNLNLGLAKIATYGTRAVDVFYVRSMFGLKIVEAGRLQLIESKLLECLARGDAALAEGAAQRE